MAKFDIDIKHRNSAINLDYCIIITSKFTRKKMRTADCCPLKIIINANYALKEAATMAKWAELSLVAAKLLAGILTIRLARAALIKEYFCIDAIKTTSLSLKSKFRITQNSIVVNRNFKIMWI